MVVGCFADVGGFASTPAWLLGGLQEVEVGEGGGQVSVEGRPPQGDLSGGTARLRRRVLASIMAGGGDTSAVH
eukprot:606231-Prorocentrum_lima.AAC.1